MGKISMIGLVAAFAAAPVAAKADGDWSVSLTPYLWVAFPQGDVAAASGGSLGSGGIGGGGGGGGGNVDFPDINFNLDDVGLSGAFTGAADFRYRRFGVLADVTYYEIKADKDITATDLPDIDGKATVSGTKAMLVGYWRAYETEKSAVDLLGGVHYLDVDTKVRASTPNRDFSFSVGKDLWDPVIGVRGKTRFGDHFGVSGIATYGGFGVSSDSLYELQGYLTYRFNSSITAEAGYRYYSTKWEARRLDYDASFSGPLVGLTFTF